MRVVCYFIQLAVLFSFLNQVITNSTPSGNSDSATPSISFTMDNNPPPPPSPPSDVQVSNVTSETAIISWYIDSPIESLYAFNIEYKTIGEESLTSSTLIHPALRSYQLQDLYQMTAYIVQVTLIDINEFQFTSDFVDFSTLSENDEIDDSFECDSSSQTSLALAIFFGLLCALLILASFLYWLYNFNYKKKKNASNPVRYITMKPQKNYFGERKSTKRRRIVDTWWEIPRENLSIDELLGQGNFGLVHKGRVEIDIAVKMLRKEGNVSEKLKKDLYGELLIMSSIGHHENIVNFVGACIDEGKLYVVTELATCGSLKEWLLNNRPDKWNETSKENGPTLPLFQLIQFMIDIAKGMKHLSSREWIHRDLAARNILLNKNLTAKVSDFGLSRDIHQDSEYITIDNTTPIPVRWCAQEILENVHLKEPLVYTTYSDIWSFGVLLWEIITMGEKPYSEFVSYTEIFEFLKSGKRLQKPYSCPSELYHLMIECWSKNPTLRPSFFTSTETLKGLLREQSQNTPEDDDYINFNQPFEQPHLIHEDGSHTSDEFPNYLSDLEMWMSEETQAI